LEEKMTHEIALEGSGTETFTSYNDLEREGRKRLTDEGRSPQQVANFATALTSWCRIHRRNKTDLVRADFQQSFDALFLRFQDVSAESIAPRTLSDRCEQMLWWRRLFESLLGTDTLPTNFHEALRIAFARSGLTKAALCRNSGISAPTLNRWLGELSAVNEPFSPQQIGDLELALDLSPGTLSRRMSVKRRARFARTKDATLQKQSTSYGERIKRNRKGIHKYSLKATEQLKKQWRGLLELKTDKGRSQATLRNTWRIKPTSRVAMRLHWSMMVNGLACPTARGHYSQITGYLGFLGLSQQHGGIGLPFEGLDTLAWLTRADYVIAYIKFIRGRADGILHNGLFTMLDTYRSHLRPETGFVWLTPELISTLPNSEIDQSNLAGDALRNAWQQKCSSAYDQLMEFTRRLKAEGKPKFSRDPNERFRTIVSNEFPMKELLRIVHELEKDPPPVHQVLGYSVWLRDVLLMNMLVRHPLRAHHFSIMTFRGPLPHLVRSGANWHLHIDLSDFKNEKSSAASWYSVKLDKTLSHWLNRYLSEARCNLVDAEQLDYLFLKSHAGPVTGEEHAGPAVHDEPEGASPTGVWFAEGISRRLSTLTARYNTGGMAFGAHAFRHITATDHLKRNPKEYVVVAKILNDSLQTVLGQYDHTEMQDGTRALATSIELAEAQLRDESGQ
jgi:hypothetical protein